MGAFLDEFTRFMQRGGPVMWPLLGLSVIVLGLGLERFAFWWSMHKPASKRRIARLLAALRTGDRDAVRSLAAGDGSPYSELALRLIEPGDPEAATVEIVETQRPRLERFTLVFSTVVTAAPMLGILGTVLGIIQSFELLGSSVAWRDPAEVSGGIAEALISTAFGLVVALIALVPYSACRGQIERAFGRLESMAAIARGRRS